MLYESGYKGVSVYRKEGVVHYGDRYSLGYKICCRIPFAPIVNGVTALHYTALECKDCNRTVHS